VDIRVIPNGVDLERLNPGEILPGQPPMIVFAGRFVEQKNPLRLVRTLVKLGDLPWKCILVGDGPLRPEIEAEITQANMCERFSLPGWLEPDQVVKRLQESDILFMPSRAEGLPVVGLQALASGLAIVSSRVGGFVDLVTPGENGYLIDYPDSTEFEPALRSLLSDPARLKAFRDASREKARLFDLNRIVAEYATEMTRIVRGAIDD